MNVYLIWEEGTSKYKIGKANDVDSRKSTFQTGNSNLLKTIGVIEAQDAERKEKYFQSKYRNYHHRGEWFNFPPQVLFEVFADFSIKDMDVFDTPVYKLLLENHKLQQNTRDLKNHASKLISSVGDNWSATSASHELRAEYLMDNPINTQKDLDNFRRFEREVILVTGQIVSD